MTIAAEIAFPKGYEWAIVRFATSIRFEKKSQPPVLVFASVEFVHADRPKPDSTPLNAKNIPPHIGSQGPSLSTVYFRRVAMEATAAFEWYREAAAGNITTPLAADPSDRGRHDGGPLGAPSLMEEPPWPRLSFPISDQSLFHGEAYYPSPFIGPGAAPARIHRLMAAADPDLEALTQDITVSDWLASRVHFRIDEYPELLGSITLIAPDTQVRSVRQYLARDSNGEERLVTLVQPRTGKRLDEIELTILEERFGAISTFKRERIPLCGCVITEAPAEIRSSGYMLAHSERGLISFQPPLPFIRAVGLKMETSSRRARIQTRDSKRKDAEVQTHEIGEFALAADSLIGDKMPALGAHERFFDAVEQRRIRSQSRQSDQRWINDVVAARAFLRTLIGSARNEIFVADCFFGDEELSNYLHFVRRLNVHLKVLTSRLAFGNGETRAASVQRMEQVLRTFRDRGLKEVDVRVMSNKGGEPILHDRFLVVDGAVWFTGNSFNAIGQRESMIVKLPNPAPVIDRLSELFRSESYGFIALSTNDEE